MKKLLVSLLFIISIVQGYAQVLEPVKWSTSVERISDTEYQLVSKATIDSGWHLYSQNVPQDGPIPTSFTYNDSTGQFNIIGNNSEEKGHTIDDPVFQMRIKFFEKTAVFKQKVKVLEGVSTINFFMLYNSIT